MSMDALPEMIYVCAALPEGFTEGDDLSEIEDLTLVSLTDMEENGFMPIFSEEEKLLTWIQDFQVDVMSVTIPRDTLVELAKEGQCSYFVMDLEPGQAEFPINQVFNL